MDYYISVEISIQDNRTHIENKENIKKHLIYYVNNLQKGFYNKCGTK